MSAKTIFIIVITIVITVILMKNTDEVNFWIFGTRSIPKLAVFGVTFALGFILCYLVTRPKKTKTEALEENSAITTQEDQWEEQENYINPEDEEYIN